MKYPLIVSDQYILGGKPCIKNTRISVALVLEWVASGATPADIHAKYSHVSLEGIREAILYAAESMKNEIVIEVQHPLAA